MLSAPRGLPGVPLEYPSGYLLYPSRPPGSVQTDARTLPRKSHSQDMSFCGTVPPCVISFESSSQIVISKSVTFCSSDHGNLR